MSDLTTDTSRDLLAYEPETGLLRWRRDLCNQYSAGDVAGSVTEYGYRRVRVLGRKYMAHRLAWLIHYGEFPNGQIDHINCQKDDNRIANLRVVSGAMNSQNERQARRRSKTGFLGVSPDGNKFKAQIVVNRRVRFLGNFPTPEEAHAAYVAAKRQLHPGCTL